MSRYVTYGPLIATLVGLGACHRSTSLGEDAGTSLDMVSVDSPASDPDFYLEVRFDEGVAPYDVMNLSSGGLVVLGGRSTGSNVTEAAFARLSPDLEEEDVRTLRIREVDTIDAFFGGVELPGGDLVVVGSSLRRTAFIARVSPEGIVRWAKGSRDEEVHHHLNTVSLTAEGTLVAAGSRNESRVVGELQPMLVEFDLDGNESSAAVLDLRGDAGWVSRRVDGWLLWARGTGDQPSILVRMANDGSVEAAWRLGDWWSTNVAQTEDGTVYVSTFENGFYAIDLEEERVQEVSVPFRVSSMNTQGNRVTIRNFGINTSDTLLTFEGTRVVRSRRIDPPFTRCLETASLDLRCASRDVVFRIRPGAAAQCSVGDAPAPRIAIGPGMPLRAVRVSATPIPDPIFVSLTEFIAGSTLGERRVACE